VQVSPLETDTGINRDKTHTLKNDRSKSGETKSSRERRQKERAPHHTCDSHSVRRVRTETQRHTAVFCSRPREGGMCWGACVCAHALTQIQLRIGRKEIKTHSRTYARKSNPKLLNLFANIDIHTHLHTLALTHTHRHKYIGWPTTLQPTIAVLSANST
jgi:hypothetical protein